MCLYRPKEKKSYRILTTCRSPWWHVRKGNLPAARASLARLTSPNQPGFSIDETLAMIEHTDALERNVALLIRTIIGKSMETGSDVKAEIQESMALSFACMTAIPYGRILTSEEMLLIVSQLFASKTPTYTPDGQRVISMISDQDIEKRLQ